MVLLIVTNGLRSFLSMLQNSYGHADMSGNFSWGLWLGGIVISLVSLWCVLSLPRRAAFALTRSTFLTNPQRRDTHAAIIPIDAAEDDLTQKLPKLSTLTTNSLPRDLDSLFWAGIQGGLIALTHHDLWIASLQLQSVVTTLMTSPLLTAAMAEFQSQHSGVLQIQGEAAAIELKTAYQTIIARYLSLRQAMSIPTSPHAAIEQETLNTLDIVTRQNYNFDEVLSWHTHSIILPAYNEEEVIADTVYDCLRAVRRFCPNCEIIVVDDGSRDRTGQIIDDLALHDSCIIAVHNRPNKGYGGALVAGFNAARGQWLFFMDSDGQFDIRDIASLLTVAQEHPDAAMLGYRAHRSDPFMRQLNAWGWKQATRRIIGLRGIHDIDCAFKLFPAHTLAAAAIIAEGASVNAEFLTKFQRMHVPIYQLPVQHLPRTKGNPTGAKLSVILKAFRELFHLRVHLRTWKPTEVNR